MNYYPFHIGDYVSATRHLSWEEDAAFRRLLDTYYTTEKPIPADLRAACRLVMAQTDSQREAVRVVLEEFFVLIEQGWVNKRADGEIAAMREKQQKQRDKANKRWHKPEQELGIATAVAADAVASKTNADAMPPTPTPTPTPKKRKEIAPLALVIPGVDEQTAADFQKLRKAKRAPLTATALEGIQAEADKAGLTLQAALAMACQRGWTSFKADWVRPDARDSPPTETAWQRSQRELVERASGGLLSRTRNLHTEIENVAAIEVG